MYVLIVILVLLVVILGYTTFNLFKKLETYEDSIEQFYSALSVVLDTMRNLDEKQMFESDDEVGTVFKQLADILFTLRPIIYGKEQDEEKN